MKSGEVIFKVIALVFAMAVTLNLVSLNQAANYQSIHSAKVTQLLDSQSTINDQMANRIYGIEDALTPSQFVPAGGWILNAELRGED